MDRAELVIALNGVPESEVRLPAAELGDASLVSRLEHRLTGLEHLREVTVGTIERRRAEVMKAEELVGRPFPGREQLAAARNRTEEIGAKLKEAADRKDEDKTPPIDPGVSAIPEPSERSEQRKEWPRRAISARQPPPTLLGTARAAGARLR